MILQHIYTFVAVLLEKKQRSKTSKTKQRQNQNKTTNKTNERTKQSDFSVFSFQLELTLSVIPFLYNHF